MKVLLDLDNGDALDMTLLIHLDVCVLDMISTLTEWDRGVHGRDGLLDDATRDALRGARAGLNALKAEVDRQAEEFYDKRVMDE